MTAQTHEWYSGLSNISNCGQFNQDNVTGSWWSLTLAKLDALLKYPEDSNRWSPRCPVRKAYSVAVTAIVGIEHVSSLPLPRIFATPDGGVRFGWRKDGRELDIEIMYDGSIDFLMLEPGAKPTEGQIAEAPKKKVNELAQWLAG